ncbi:MAG: UvrB/UvrC motif-containing protein [Verrucomicrobiota bacterium]
MAENLKCSLCDKDATVHLTQIVNNKIHKIDLCESCAQKKGVTDPEGFSLADLLSKAGSFSSVEKGGGATCPNCGHSTADFRRTGRLGCAACFDVFAEQLAPVLADMHVGVEHRGKVPKHALRRQSGRERLEKLQIALDRAVADEAYEDAAKYRDEIKKIESEEDAEVFQA